MEVANEVSICSSENTRVIDSRPADDNNSIRRHQTAMIAESALHLRKWRPFADCD